MHLAFYRRIGTRAISRNSGIFFDQEGEGVDEHDAETE